MEPKAPKAVETAEMIARIDTKIRDKMLKRARRYGMDESEVIKHLEEWKRAGRRTRRLQLRHG